MFKVETCLYLLLVFLFLALSMHLFALFPVSEMFRQSKHIGNEFLSHSFNYFTAVVIYNHLFTVVNA